MSVGKLTFLNESESSSRPHPFPVPFWNLTPKLKDLSIDFYSRSDFEDIAEQDEATCAAFKLSTQPPSAQTDIDALNVSVVTRTIIAAARNGSLRSLSLKAAQVQAPFAMRTMLPLWVILQVICRGYGDRNQWTLAASGLRSLLAHASLWLDGAQASRTDRSLTLQEVQGLQSQLRGRRHPQAFRLVRWSS